MLVLMHIEKEQVKWIAESGGGDEPPVPPIEWCTRGTGGGSDHVVVLYDVDRLVKDLLPQFAFAPITESSFVRKLCRWGFQQVSSVYGKVQKNHSNRPHSSHMYECNHFKKGNFALLTRMSSDTAEKRRHQASLAADSESPDVLSTSTSSGNQSNYKRRPNASTGRKRDRTDLEGGNPRSGLPPVTQSMTTWPGGIPHPTTANNDGSSILLHHTMYRHPVVPIQMVALPSSLLRPGATVSHVIGAAPAQMPLFGSLQQPPPSSGLYPTANHLFSPTQAGAIQPLPLSDLERFQILQAAHGHPSLATWQHQAPLSVASLAAAAAQPVSSTIPLQIDDPARLAAVPARRSSNLGVGQQASWSTDSQAGNHALPQQHQYHLQPMLAPMLVPNFTRTSVPPQEIDPHRSNLTLQELMELVRRAQQPHQNPP
jgi:HSF-type DNA-binding